MNLAGRMIAVLAGLALLWTREAHAIAPNYIPDDELAKYPIIVVATWDKAPATSHCKYRRDKDHEEIVIKCEAYTRLNIRTVVKGSVEPGVCELLLGWGIAWDKNGKHVTTGTSTELPGDVDDITKPCVWFLKRTRSWDENRKTAYLTVSNYREIQPLDLKEYFVALGAADAATRVPKLLSPDKPIVADRVLRYICGGRWPWPYSEDKLLHMYFEPEKQGPLLRDEANRVWGFVNTDAKELRRSAASVYAELRGKDCVPKMRTLLDDRDSIVRGIAVGILAQHRDEASLDRFAKAVEGLTDDSVACKVVEALSAWKDERVVPALVGFLQNDGFAYQYGDELGIPALKASQGLLAITGHAFPFDVNQSRKAWQEAVRTDDKAARRRLLERAAPGSQAPFVAAAVGAPREEVDKALKWLQVLVRMAGGDDSSEMSEVVVTIRLRNVTARPVTILKQPSSADMSWPGGLVGVGADAQKQEFATVSPGQFIEFETKLRTDFLIEEPSKRRLKLFYLRNGNRCGVNAWIGMMDVAFGSEWKGKRDVKRVEETWPNGNLKVTGTIVNGIKFGDWNYFNEQGDRIRIESRHGTGDCNPEYPDNKGAGRRKAK